MNYFDIIDLYNLYKIFLYLPNEDLLKLQELSKYVYTIYSDVEFKKKIRFRYHPTIFNLIDNYCSLCNIPKKYFSINYPLGRCSHI